MDCALIFLNFQFYFSFCMSVLLTTTSVHHVCAWCPQRLAKGAGSPELSDYEPSCKHCELNLDLLLEQQMFLAIGPFDELKNFCMFIYSTQSVTNCSVLELFFIILFTYFMFIASPPKSMACSAFILCILLRLNCKADVLEVSHLLFIYFSTFFFTCSSIV